MTELPRFLDPQVLAAISGLELRAKAVVEGFLSGLHRSPFKGFSVEFAEYRQYTPGDDPRHIDWKVYARSDKFYVKEFEEETNLSCHLLFDVSKSMTYGSGKVSKLDYASYLAASLAYLLVRQRDSVGLAAFSDKIETLIPPKSRPGHLHTILTALENVECGARTDIRAPLTQIAETLNKKGLLVLISDLLDEPENILDALQHFRFGGHDILVFHVMDDSELNFPFHHSTRFEGLEDEGHFTAQPQNVRDEYMKRLNEHIEKLKSGCSATGISYTLLNTAKPLDFALKSFLAKRVGKL